MGYQRIPLFDQLVGTGGTATADPFNHGVIMGYSGRAGILYEAGLAAGFTSCGTRGIFVVQAGHNGTNFSFKLPHVSSGYNGTWGSVLTATAHQSVVFGRIPAPWVKIRFINGTSAPIMLKAMFIAVGT